MLKGKELRLLRIYHDIKLLDIAEALSVTSAYISILENEKQEIPEHIYNQWITYFKSKVSSEVIERQIKRLSWQIE